MKPILFAFLLLFPFYSSSQLEFNIYGLGGPKLESFYNSYNTMGVQAGASYSFGKYLAIGAFGAFQKFDVSAPDRNHFFLT